MNYKKIAMYVASIVSLIFVIMFVFHLMNGTIAQTMPWIVHNQPHGTMGWMLWVTILLWIVVLITPKKLKK